MVLLLFYWKQLNWVECTFRFFFLFFLRVPILFQIFFWFWLFLSFVKLGNTLSIFILFVYTLCIFGCISYLLLSFLVSAFVSFPPFLSSFLLSTFYGDFLSFVVFSIDPFPSFLGSSLPFWFLSSTFNVQYLFFPQLWVLPSWLLPF